MANWHKLDNAAKIFPSVSTKPTNTSIFRISAILTEQVNPELLQQALDQVIKRFPHLTMRLRRGLFWYYLEEISDRLMVEPEQSYPCAPMKSYPHHRFMIKVFYYNKRISIEVYHVLTDGVGLMEFLKTLVYQYLKLKGYPVVADENILLPDDMLKDEEMEDSFKKYYRPMGFQITPEKKPLIVEGTPFEVFGNNIIHGLVSVKQILALCKSKNVTITEYITALLAYSIYAETAQHQGEMRNINIAIPVNLRKPFPSKTLRNFFSVSILSLEINRDMGLDDVLEQVHFYMKQKTSKDYLSRTIASNGKMEKMMVSRFIPLFIKDLFMGFGARNFGEKFKTTTVTNSGVIKLPDSMAPYIDWIEMTRYPTEIAPINCAVASVNDRLSITFSRTIIETKIIRHFFTYLATVDGIDVEIYSNDWGTDL